MEMRRLILIPVALMLLGAAPSRTKTYTAGNVIQPSEVTENEDNVFTYLQGGVDTYKTSSISATALASAAVTTAKIDTGAVTTSAILDGTIGLADYANNSIDGTKLAIGSDAQGDVLYYNGTDWARLGAGTSGQFLKTQGAGSNPTWSGGSGTPSLTLGTSAATGSALTFIATDATLPLYTTGASSTQAFGDAAADGTSAFCARADHKHAMPSESVNAWVFVETITLSGSSASSATLPTTPDAFLLVFKSVLGATGLQLSGDAGADYNYTSLSTTTLTSSTSQTSIAINDSTTEPLAGTMMMVRLPVATSRHPIAVNLTASVAASKVPIRAWWDNSGNVTSVTINGTSMSGEVDVYKSSQ